MDAQILAHVIRGEIVESIHRGHFIVMDGAGKTVTSAGDPSTVTFFRSACKPLQAIPLLTSGAADHFGFTEEDIAMSCASHSGEQVHVDLVAGMLEKIGASESDLRRGVHNPFSETETRRLLRDGSPPSQLHNNCSGKHAGMLALAKHIDADMTTYDLPGSRVQQRILRAISTMAVLPESEIAVAIDGCAAPNFAVPLSAMARSFINLMAPTPFHASIQSACSRIVSAMTKHPELVGGTNRLDTQVMQAAKGRVLSKVGADGVWVCAVFPSERWPTGLAIALKIEDGDDYLSRPVVVVEILRKLDLLAADDLVDLSPMPVKNRRGDQVGHIEAVPVF